MPQPFLLIRVLLQFGSKDDDLFQELSAVTLTPDGSLWVGSDEFLILAPFAWLAPLMLILFITSMVWGLEQAQAILIGRSSTQERRDV